MRSARIDAGTVTIRSIDGDHPRPESSSTWSDWGEMDPAAVDLPMDRWLVELTRDDGSTEPVGDMSAHSVWYGPTAPSRARNIGIGIVDGYRGQGIGSVAQRLLAEELHDRGVIRVEASTDVANTAEQRALARAGFVFEGTLRLAQGRRDGQHDLQVWSHVRYPAPAGTMSAPGESRVTLRHATVDDVALLRHWDEQPHVIAASGDDAGADWATSIAEADEFVEYLIAEEAGRPVGVVQIIDPARERTHYWGECESDLRAIDIWIGDEADLGRGLGTIMMRLALARCFTADGVEAVVIDPLADNTAARRFYARLGFVEVGPRRFGADDCVVYRLDRGAWAEREARP